MGKHGRDGKRHKAKTPQQNGKSAPIGPEQANRPASNKDAAHHKEQYREQNLTPTKGARSQAPDQHGCPPVASTDTQYPSEQPSPAKPTAREQKAWRDCCTLKINAWAAVINTLSFIAAGVALLFVYGQLTAMRDQLDQMTVDSNSTSAAMKKQLEAMNIQGDAMRQQVGVMSSQLDQMRADSLLDSRAWVSYRTGTMKQLEPNQPPQCRIVLGNTGKTPAFNLKVSHHLAIRRPPFDIKTYATAFEDEKLHPAIGEAPLAPNAICIPIMPKDTVINKESVAQVKSGQRVVYTFGIVRYDDHIGGHHTTRYCHVWDPNANELKVYHQYNYMD